MIDRGDDEEDEEVQRHMMNYNESEMGLQNPMMMESVADLASYGKTVDDRKGPYSNYGFE